MKSCSDHDARKAPAKVVFQHIAIYSAPLMTNSPSPSADSTMTERLQRYDNVLALASIEECERLLRASEACETDGPKRIGAVLLQVRNGVFGVCRDAGLPAQRLGTYERASQPPEYDENFLHAEHAVAMLRTLLGYTTETAVGGRLLSNDPAFLLASRVGNQHTRLHAESADPEAVAWRERWEKENAPKGSLEEQQAWQLAEAINYNHELLVAIVALGWDAETVRRVFTHIIEKLNRPKSDVSRAGTGRSGMAVSLKTVAHTAFFRPEAEAYLRGIGVDVNALAKASS